MWRRMVSVNSRSARLCQHRRRIGRIGPSGGEDSPTGALAGEGCCFSSSPVRAVTVIHGLPATWVTVLPPVTVIQTVYIEHPLNRASVGTR